MKRRAYAIEIDAIYVDAILRRMEAFTGALARCAATNVVPEPAF